jgi:outer membrane protein assembly factor BamD (BamD/ComL family)
MPRGKGIVAVICLLLGGLGCSPIGAVVPRPDEALFERAMLAAEQKHFAAARLGLETLINTYPGSEYSGKAKLALQDPRIANADCEFTEASWSN